MSEKKQDIDKFSEEETRMGQVEGDMEKTLEEQMDMTDLNKDPQTGNFRKLKIGIVGHGFVGGAIDYAFTHPEIEKFYVDPKHNTTLADLIDWEPHVSFVCVPTPMGEDGNVESSMVEDAVLQLLEHTKGGVNVKSTIPPHIVDRITTSIFEDDHKRLTFNPEFLTESNAKEQFVNAPYHIIGGHPDACRALAQLYDVYSLCHSDEYVFMSGPEASFVKYGVNAFLATKVTFFNQLYDAIDKFRCNYPTIVQAIGKDSRIGHSHTKVPGYDGKRGFGGACFPKDLSAFMHFDPDLTLIEKCVSINNDYRKQYELDEREESNNVKYNGQTEEEQQDQDNGSVVGE